MEKVMIRIGHGYFEGGINPLPDVSPTIDAHIACWHVLIGEKVKDIKIKEATKKGYTEAEVGDSINLQFPNSQTRRGRVGKGVAQTLDCNCEQGVIENYRIRKLTPLECWRLMNFDDEDFKKAKAAGISDSQLYRQAGNSIVVAVLEAIFKQML